MIKLQDEDFARLERMLDQNFTSDAIRSLAERFARSASVPPTATLAATPAEVREAILGAQRALDEWRL